MNLEAKINELERENEEGLEKARKLKLKELKAIANQRAYEEAKFEQFKKIIEGQRYFRIEHLEKLKIKYDIAIHLSAKNVGKTTELYRLIRATLQRGKKFIYGRVTVQELETEVEKFREDEMSPVLLVKHDRMFYFFEKSKVMMLIDENETFTPTYKALVGAGLEVVGRGMTFLGSNVLGSGNYTNYDTIFFDEIVSYTPKQYVNDKILYNWGCAVSTILRNKDKLTIIMMGNLQNNITEVPVLTYYDIDIADNLRVIERTMGEGENKEPCTILYVNSGSLYNNSLKNQASVAHHASLDDRLFMEHNKVINPNVKILNRAVVSKMESVCACAVEYLDEFFALELRSFTSPKSEEYFALCVHPMKVTTALNVEIYTHDPVVSNRFSTTIYRKNMRSVYKFMFKLFTGNALYYDCMNSVEIGSWCMNDVIRRYIEATEPARYR